MNIQITDSWIREYLETDATPEEIQKYLSLCGPSIERVGKKDDDYIYDIEVTSNRIDMASVIGLAREASAILPRFGKKAKLKKFSFPLPSIQKNSLSLKVVDDEHLTHRVLAIMVGGVKLGESPPFIQKRLEAAGIRSLNNLVDITNYVMLEIGHPTHVFDYDRIKTGTFVFRKAESGEKLTTLDAKTFVLKGGEVVIDDGTGRIIDLPSIMGTYNSVVTGTTKRLIFFVDHLDPALVRKASMTHGIRTLAATYNEKNPDKELALTALHRGAELLQKYASPSSMSSVLDISREPYKEKTITVTTEFIFSRMGIVLPKKDISTILENLGFMVKLTGETLEVGVPSWRSEDVTIPEDVVEEIARIYGYHNLPDTLQPMVYLRQPKEIEMMLALQSKLKYFLKHIGIHEVMNYSMISKELLKKAGHPESEFLKLKNTISEEIEYMRRHILPSLFMNIKENEGKKETLRFFELSKTYKKRKDDLPLESYKLGVVVNTSYEDIKGIIDILLQELNITKYEVKKSEYDYMSKHVQGEIGKGSDWLVKYGELSPLHKAQYGIRSNLYTAVFDVDNLIKHYRPIGDYTPINHFAEVKQDLTIDSNPKMSFADLQKKAETSSSFLSKVELVDTFKSKLNLRFYFSAPDRNLTEEEAKKELEAIKKAIAR